MKLDRLIGILTVLLQKDKVTASELADRFNVSHRTILRDIDTLCLAGIPVVTSRGGSGGIFIMEGYKIDKNVLNAEEMQTLAAGLKGIESVSKQSVFGSLMDKLAPSNSMISLKDSIIIDLSSHYKDSISEKIQLFKEAISNQRTVEFDYYYSKGETQREIEPYFVEFRWNSWYIFGKCRLREDFRRFKLNRLWNCKITEKSFEMCIVPIEKSNAEDAFSEEHHIKILFDKSVRFRLIESYGLNCYEEREDGLLLSLDYTNKDYMLNWVLGFGDRAKVLEPKEIQEEIISIVKNIVSLYD